MANIFIENLKQSYVEAMSIIENDVKDKILLDKNMQAMDDFTKATGKITEIQDVLDSTYRYITSYRDLLIHFKSKKANFKIVPTYYLLKETGALGDYAQQFRQIMEKEYRNFQDENDNFLDDEFAEFFSALILDELGYNKKHWWIKSRIINEIDYMFDFLIDFLEDDYNPIQEDNDNNEGTQDIDRNIPKAVKVAVWRRDLGKCVQCGSREKLEYDHIIPVSKGGSNTERNVQLLCEKCNRTKSANIQ